MWESLHVNMLTSFSSSKFPAVSTIIERQRGCAIFQHIKTTVAAKKHFKMDKTFEMLKKKIDSKVIVCLIEFKVHEKNIVKYR